jgi:lysophospholipid acyltransferase (LPLAT)-like uncharacterized protein
MKRIGKWLFKRRPVQWLLIGLVEYWLRFVFLSCKKTYHIPEASRAFMDGNQQAIACFWHGRMIMQPFVKPPKRAMHVLISQHRDGGFITDIIARFNIGVVRGSRSKGGAEAMREMQQLASSGTNFCITPDGPRGPAFTAAPGAARLALATGLPLFACAFSASRYRKFNSWDQFILPKPFGHIHYVLSPPIFPDGNAENRETIDALTAHLEAAINQAMHKSDQRSGRQT